VEILGGHSRSVGHVTQVKDQRLGASICLFVQLESA
jgi:hypothetical protein